jgi:hypothetical protein
MLSTIEEESFNKSKFGLSICLFKLLYLFVSFFGLGPRPGLVQTGKHRSEDRDRDWYGPENIGPKTGTGTGDRKFLIFLSINILKIESIFVFYGI